MRRCCRFCGYSRRSKLRCTNFACSAKVRLLRCCSSFPKSALRWRFSGALCPAGTLANYAALISPVRRKYVCFVAAPLSLVATCCACSLPADAERHRVPRGASSFPKSALRWRFSGALCDCPSLRACQPRFRPPRPGGIAFPFRKDELGGLCPLKPPETGIKIPEGHSCKLRCTNFACPALRARSLLLGEGGICAANDGWGLKRLWYPTSVTFGDSV